MTEVNRLNIYKLIWPYGAPFLWRHGTEKD